MPVFAKREYTLELTTPAFLGGADQSAEWRTPGIKALIRQWWRVAYVAEHGLNVELMRRAEGELFGTVNDDQKNARRAKISLRFSDLLKSDIRVLEQKIDNNDNSQALPYLGYGPFDSPTKPSNRTALREKSSSRLTIICQAKTREEVQQIAEKMDQVIWLISRFGTIGSRAKNGWGSLKVSGLNSNPALKNFLRHIDQCFQVDWITGIATDKSGPMIWTTPVRSDWKQVMKDLKFIRKEQNGTAKDKRKRGVVNAPAGGNPRRWPNQFAFKVLPQGDKFIGQIALFGHQWPGYPNDIKELLVGIAAQLDGSGYTRIQA